MAATGTRARRTTQIATGARTAVVIAPARAGSPSQSSRMKATTTAVATRLQAATASRQISELRRPEVRGEAAGLGADMLGDRASHGPAQSPPDPPRTSTAA